MYLKYLDGSSADDGLFDLSLNDRRAHVASMLNCHPETPGTWPLGAIDRLLGIRQCEGERRFTAELHKMLSPYPTAARS